MNGIMTTWSVTPSAKPSLAGSAVGRLRVTGLFRVDPDADGDGVVGAVVAALHLGELASSGEGPCGPNGVQRGLCARVGEAHQVKAGYPLAKQLGQADLVVIGGVVGYAIVELLFHRVHDRPWERGRGSWWSWY